MALRSVDGSVCIPTCKVPSLAATAGLFLVTAVVALADLRGAGIAIVLEGLGERVHELELAIHRGKDRRAAVGGYGSCVESIRMEGG